MESWSRGVVGTGDSRGLQPRYLCTLPCPTSGDGRERTSTTINQSRSPLWLSGSDAEQRWERDQLLSALHNRPSHQPRPARHRNRRQAARTLPNSKFQASIRLPSSSSFCSVSSWPARWNPSIPTTTEPPPTWPISIFRTQLDSRTETTKKTNAIDGQSYPVARSPDRNCRGRGPADPKQASCCPSCAERTPHPGAALSSSCAAGPGRGTRDPHPSP